MAIRSDTLGLNGRSKTTRRAFLAAVSTGAAALLAACSAPAPAPGGAGSTAAPPSSTTTAPAAKPAAAPADAAPSAPTSAERQVLNVAVPDVGSEIDPYGPVGGTAPYYPGVMYERLGTMYNPNSEPQPSLAQSWRIVDPTTWEFTLREVKFWDGSPLTSEDVQFSLERGLDINLSLPAVPTLLSTITGIEAPNPKTVVIRTRVPDPVLPNRVSSVAIYSKKAFEAAGSREKFNVTPMGTGPYKLKSFQQKQSVELVANDDWWGGRPSLAGLKFFGIPDPAARVATIITGECDVAQGVSVDQMDQLSQIAKTVVAHPPVMLMIRFDASAPELRDKRVRLALNHAVDLNTITQTLLRGVVEPAPGQPAIKQIFGYNPNLQPYEYNPDRAKQLLAEAGFPNGFEATLGFGNYLEPMKTAAEAVQPYLARVGVNVELWSFPYAEFQDKYYRNALGPMFLLGNSARDLADPALAYTRFLSDPQLGGIGNWINPEFDRLFIEAEQELDREKRRALYQEMNRILHDDPAGIYLWGLWDVWAVSNKVSGFDPPPLGLPPFATITKAP